ncbi:MAG: glycosyltransferase family 9 protein [Bacteriovoracaceae bacterium]
MHILLVRFSSMGDVVLQTATVNWLRSLFGNKLRVTFVTSREFVSLVEGHPGINAVIGFDRRKDHWKDFVGKVVAAGPYDLVLDLHATMRSFRLKWALWAVPQLTVDKRRWERFLLTKLKSIFFGKIWKAEPQVERIINDIQDIFGDERGVRATKDFRHGPHGEMTSLCELPVYKLPEKYIVIAPSASFLPKRWPIENFVKLTERLLETTDLTMVVLAGPDDRFCEAFEVIKSHRLINLQGKTTLKESMSVLERAQLSIGNDSGMNHIAEAYGVPVVTIFGPTHPAFGFAPHGSKSRYHSVDIWCKPCSTTGSSPCYRKDLYCMKMISVDEVLASAREALA